MNKPKGLRELLRKVRFICIHWKIEAVNFTQFFVKQKVCFPPSFFHCVSLLLDSTIQLSAMRISKLLILELNDTVNCCANLTDELMFEFNKVHSDVYVPIKIYNLVAFKSNDVFVYSKQRTFIKFKYFQM